MGPIGVVRNPHSRKNRRHPAKREARLREILGGGDALKVTSTVDDIGPAVRDLLRGGARYVVSDGGDGAMHWLLNTVREVVSEPEFRDVALPAAVPTNGGTIDFVAQKVGVVGEGLSIVESLVEGERAGAEPEIVEVDSLDVTGECETPDGVVPFRRMGFALAAGGIGRRFFDEYYRAANPGVRTILQVVGRAVLAQVGARAGLSLPPAISELGRRIFAPTLARVTIDGSELDSTEHGALHAGAFDISLGGVFRVFPLAADDGVLHFQAGTITPAEIVRALPDLHRGSAIRSARMVDTRGRRMDVEALGPELLCPIIDGEPFVGLRRMTVRAGPRVRVARVVARRGLVGRRSRTAS